MKAFFVPMSVSCIYDWFQFYEHDRYPDRKYVLTKETIPRGKNEEVTRWVLRQKNNTFDSNLDALEIIMSSADNQFYEHDDCPSKISWVIKNRYDDFLKNNFFNYFV